MLCKEDIERVFALYDRVIVGAHLVIAAGDKILFLSFFLGGILQDNNGTIENEELRGFLKDLLELVKKVRKIIFDRPLSSL